MVTQFVPRPAVIEFVCACKCQPVRSAGHDNVRVLPETVVVIFVGFVFTGGEVETTFNASVLMLVTRMAFTPDGSESANCPGQLMPVLAING